MASLVLSAVGSAVGASVLGNFSFLGITGAQIGGAIGALAGSYVDAAIAGGRNVHREGSRLSDVNIQSSSEGATIPRIYGRCRVAGQLIWATRFKETATTTRTSSGGKGLPKTVVSETDYTYSISFAVGLCAGEITKIGRVWADGTLINLSAYTVRVYGGSETQDADPLIESIEGEDNVPAYRGLAYVVFEDMPLAEFGNRIPQLQFEIIRSIGAANPDALENRLRGVALIPGAGEFVYATEPVMTDDGAGTTLPENAHNTDGIADIAASLDELQALAPNTGAVSLVVGWFGNDLRCAECAIQPGVESGDKTTHPETWSVNGIARGVAHAVSQVDGKPAYGGTPSDEAVVAAIADLKARGLAIMFNPFLFMDVESGNALSDPYTGAEGQPAYPWRGRITCDPAPGASGTPDKTSGAAAQVSAFFGSATSSDFTVTGTEVAWSGGSDWGYRRMILHYAHLCVVAGGVDAFLIGSELMGLTHVRDSDTSYPAVAALKALAADVRAILGATVKIGYAADWSEYNNHQTGDAPGAVLFNLDPLWSDANIDFIGIDNYMPLADWRDGNLHLDATLASSPHNADYLAANIRGGEDYEWFYASGEARAAQTRTPITDGLGKPWVFRTKDLWNWWNNAHYDRADGTECASATDWVPRSKPIWFTELGCPAINKGANEPNVFYDPKSSESALPYWSNGERDDLMQRRFLEAHLNFWNDGANNPDSDVYSGPMVDTANIYAWCWDARPYPFFPARSDVWGDWQNWRLGHWLNGRLGAVTLSDMVAEICALSDFADCDVSRLSGLVTGFAVTGTMSARDALEPLALAYHFDAVESEGTIGFVPRGGECAAAITEDDLVIAEHETGSGFVATRAQETDLPQVSRISYIDADVDYRQAVAEAHRLVGASDRVAQSSLPLVLDQGQAIGIGERLLQDAWVARETVAFVLPPSRLALDPADAVSLNAGGRDWCLRIGEIGDAGARTMSSSVTDPSIYEHITGVSRAPAVAAGVPHFGRALTVFLDLPWLGAGNDWAPFAAAIADPWPGAVLLLKSATQSNYTLDTPLTLPASLGETTADFYSGPLWRWDDVNELQVRLYAGSPSSQDDLAILGGANALAVQNEDGEWEVLQFGKATLTAPGHYTLTHLLRGQAGSEGAMRAPVAAGARVVLLDGALRQLSLSRSEFALPFHWLWGPQGKPISDPAFQGTELQFQGIGLRPLAPVHVSARPEASGDVVISWIRRTREGGDPWEQTEVPLGEESESYAIDILYGGTVLRTLTASTTTATYSAPDQTADFGSLPSAFDVEIFQLSPAFGRGAPARKTLNVR